MKKGKFIVLEGPDGSGKSSFGKHLSHYLEKMGIKYVISREPGGTRIGEEIRTILLNKNHGQMNSRCEALLYAAARAQHIEEVIRPALDDNKIVISDRFLLSSLAYQAYGRGLAIEDILSINYFAMKGIEPDLLIYFKAHPEELLGRRDTIPDRIEKESMNFHEKVYLGYEELIEKEKTNKIIIDATQDEKIVADEGIQAVVNFVEGR